tara:strand:+ start:51 stop:521 length:471 start_codon:yes stop_codon:yes gene_type:complete
MIIICPCCDKKFEVDENLIPNKGRLLKCGSCDHTWFFDKNKEINNGSKEVISPSKKITNKILSKKSTVDTETKDITIAKISDNKGSEIVRYENKSNFIFTKFLSYILVIIISFIGLILVLDTFKSTLYSLFPNLEFLLFSLYETLKDIELFAKDLI